MLFLSNMHSIQQLGNICSLISWSSDEWIDMTAKQSFSRSSCLLSPGSCFHNQSNNLFYQILQKRVLGFLSYSVYLLPVLWYQLPREQFKYFNHQLNCIPISWEPNNPFYYDHKKSVKCAIEHRTVVMRAACCIPSAWLD